MNARMNRRELLQWAGLVATGAVLSPTPFAALDDLTIRTQTHGRSRALPAGELARLRRRCSGCPRGCAIDVLTVGGAPYLCVPAPGAGPASAGCPLLPAVHQLALHPHRARHAAVRTGFGMRRLSLEQGADLLVDWIHEDGRRPTSGDMALLDLSGRPPLARPIDALARALGAPTLIERDNGYGWLDRFALENGLPDRTALGVDPTAAEVLSPLDGVGVADPVLRPAAVAPARPMIFRPDGSGSRPCCEVETRARALLHESVAIGDALPAWIRPWPVPLGLDAVADESVSLLLVDASRAVCAVPWRRLRRKLVPGTGRLVVWSSMDGPAFRLADLALGVAASLERDEVVGGDRFQPRPGLALALGGSGQDVCGPEEIAARLGVRPAAVGERLAHALVESGSGRVESGDGDDRPVARFDPPELEAALESGAVWRAERVEVTPGSDVNRTPWHPRRRAPWIAFEGPVVVASGAPLPPALSKVAREARTHGREGTARAHPATLRALGVDPGRRCAFRTSRGSVELTVREDDSAPEGAVVAALGYGADCFGDAPERAGETPVLAALDFDPQLDPADVCVIEEVM